METHQYIVKKNGAVAQLARAPALQAGGQEFDSPQLHHKLNYIIICNLIKKQSLDKNLKFNEVERSLDETKIWNYKRVVQGKRGKNYEIVLIVHRIIFDEV